MDIIKNYEKYQGNKTFKKMFAKKIKLVRGNEEKILNYYIPTIVLFELDPDYFSCIMSGKWNNEEISYGIDEQLESFEGFEAFVKDYIKYEDKIQLDITKLGLEKYQTALRFNKGNMYNTDIIFSGNSKFDCLISSMTFKDLVVSPYLYYTRSRERVHFEHHKYILNVSLQDNKYVLKITKLKSDDIRSTCINIFVKNNLLKRIGLSGGEYFSCVIENNYTHISIFDYGCSITIH